jgi:ribose/xylose/arabinose/galactoside ABC-type transport system permease subunit
MPSTQRKAVLNHRDKKKRFAFGGFNQLAHWAGLRVKAVAALAFCLASLALHLASYNLHCTV